jgi:hypothetical protein
MLSDAIHNFCCALPGSTTAQLENTRRVLAETEEIGQNTMTDMYGQREQLLNAQKKVLHAHFLDVVVALALTVSVCRSKKRTEWLEKLEGFCPAWHGVPSPTRSAYIL